MRKKKNFKELSKYSKVFLFKDLTVMRGKKLGLIQKTKKWNTWTVNGNIYCVKKRRPRAETGHQNRRESGGCIDERERSIAVESPDDLWTLGDDFSHVNLAELGLHDLIDDDLK